MPNYTEFLEDRLDGYGEPVGALDDRRMESPFDRYAMRELAARVAAALPSLTIRQLRVLHGLYVEGCHLREVANRLGVDPSHVCRIKQGLLEKLRVACEEKLAA